MHMSFLKRAWWRNIILSVIPIWTIIWGPLALPDAWNDERGGEIAITWAHLESRTSWKRLLTSFFCILSQRINYHDWSWQAREWEKGRAMLIHGLIQIAGESAKVQLRALCSREWSVISSWFLQKGRGNSGILSMKRTKFMVFFPRKRSL